jgi:hypothetical protein
MIAPTLANDRFAGVDALPLRASAHVDAAVSVGPDGTLGPTKTASL